MAPFTSTNWLVTCGPCTNPPSSSPLRRHEDRNTLGFDRMLEGAIDHATQRPGSLGPARAARFSAATPSGERRSPASENPTHSSRGDHDGLHRTNLAERAQPEHRRTFGGQEHPDLRLTNRLPTTGPRQTSPLRRGGRKQAIAATPWGHPGRDQLATIALAAHPEQRPAVLNALAHCEAATLSLDANSPKGIKPADHPSPGPSPDGTGPQHRSTVRTRPGHPPHDRRRPSGTGHR